MTVLVTAHAWYGDMIGGTFRLASEFAEYLAWAGYDVSYLCCDVAPERRLPARQVVNGVDVRRYLQPPDGRHFGRAARHVARSWRLVRGLLRERPIAALSGHSPLQFLGAALALRKTGAYCNYTVHSPFDDELLCGVRSGRPALGTRARAATARLVDRVNVYYANRVQTNSRFTLETMKRKHGQGVVDKGVAAPGWVDVQTFRHTWDRSTIRRRLGGAWATDEPIFFTLRRLEPRMGLDLLVRAAARLRDGPRFHVLIGGSGPLHDELFQLAAQQGVQDRVRLLGRLPDVMVPLAYGAADCFVLPTRALECFGLIALEAFAAGKPVIAARTAAIPELVARQGEQWMFDPDDEAALADRLRAFLSGKLRVTIDTRSIAEEYDRSRVLPIWESLLFPDNGNGNAARAISRSRQGSAPAPSSARAWPSPREL